MRRIKLGIFFVVLALFLGGSVSVFGQKRPLSRRVQEQPKQEVLYLTPEQEAEALEYLREVYPERVEDILVWKDLRPDQYRRGLSRAFREMRFMKMLKEKNPERYARVSEEKQLERKSRSLAKKYREADDETEKARLREELEVLLDGLFDYRQMNRKGEIERLEKRLAELREDNQKRLANKEEIVQKRLRELLGEKGLEW